MDIRPGSSTRRPGLVAPRTAASHPTEGSFGLPRLRRIRVASDLRTPRLRLSTADHAWGLPVHHHATRRCLVVQGQRCRQKGSEQHPWYARRMLQSPTIVGEWSPPIEEDMSVAWCKIDDAFVSSPRVTRAAKAIRVNGRARVIAVWVEGLTHAQRHATDGVIASEDLDLFISDREPRFVAAALVEGDLWEPCEGGHRICGFLDHYPSAEERRDRIVGASPSRARPRDRARAATGSRAGTRARPRSDTETETDTNPPPQSPRPARPATSSTAPPSGEERGSGAIDRD